jgi:protein SCO1/2
MKTLPLIFVSIAGLALAGDSRKPLPTRDRPCCCCLAAAPEPFSDQSIYQVESRWTTDRGTQIKLGELRGKPQVIAMFFTTCQSTCPIIVQQMKQIEATLTPEQRERVGFTLVTFDSERDLPDALAGYRQTHGLPAERWTLLHGRPEDVQELAALLGIKYRKTATGQFMHSNLITVLNNEGEIVHQQIGLGADIEATVNRLQKLMEH